MHYILENRKIVYKIFKYTNCADELFIQTLVYNSKFKEKLYDKKFDDAITANMRLIDWNRGKNGNPYVWRIEDKKTIEESECLFARKFDINIDHKIVQYVISRVK